MTVFLSFVTLHHCGTNNKYSALFFCSVRINWAWVTKKWDNLQWMANRWGLWTDKRSIRGQKSAKESFPPQICARKRTSRIQQYMRCNTAGCRELFEYLWTSRTSQRNWGDGKHHKYRTWQAYAFLRVLYGLNGRNCSKQWTSQASWVLHLLDIWISLYSLPSTI